MHAGCAGGSLRFSAARQGMHGQAHELPSALCGDSARKQMLAVYMGVFGGVAAWCTVFDGTGWVSLVIPRAPGTELSGSSRHSMLPISGDK
jgi:hypothetical protein